MYAKIQNNTVIKFPYLIRQLHADHPNTSFPKSLSAETLAAFDVYEVVQASVPTVDERVYSITPSVQQIDGVWTQTWKVEKLPEEHAAANVRAERDRLLMRCDWTQVVDATVDKAAWLVYRQALRDITAQDGFPWEVTWPEKP